MAPTGMAVPVQPSTPIQGRHGPGGLQPYPSRSIRSIVRPDFRQQRLQTSPFSEQPRPPPRTPWGHGFLDSQEELTGRRKSHLSAPAPAPPLLTPASPRTNQGQQTTWGFTAIPQLPGTRAENGSAASQAAGPRRVHGGRPGRGRLVTEANQATSRSTAVCSEPSPQRGG